MNLHALKAHLRYAAFVTVGCAIGVPIACIFAYNKMKRALTGRGQTQAILASAGPQTDPVPGLQHQWLSINGVKLHLARGGPATPDPARPVMLFVHGFPEAWFSWSRQLQEFQKTYDVVAFDMRGYNESDKPTGIVNYRMSLLVKDLATVIKTVSPDRKVVLVAHDWGGVVAWALARTQPDLLSHLIILCAPHPQTFMANMDLKQFSKSWYVFFFQLPWLPEAVLRDQNFEFINRMFTSKAMGLKHRENLTPEALSRYKTAMMRPGSLTSTINYYRALYRYDPDLARPKRGKLQVPTLLLNAAGDGALGPGVFRGTERFVETLEAVELPDCSHWAQQDRPELVNGLITKFLKTHEAKLGSRL